MINITDLVLNLAEYKKLEQNLLDNGKIGLIHSTRYIESDYAPKVSIRINNSNPYNQHDLLDIIIRGE